LGVAPASKIRAIFGWVHHRQRLTLVGEAGEYLAGVHAEFYYFEGY